MTTSFARALFASALLIQAAAIAGDARAPAFAETAPATQPAPAADADAEPDQKPLTEALIRKFLEAQDSLEDIIADIPEDKLDEPNPKIQATLDETARRFGFASYGEYDAVANTIAYIFGGFDPDTKAFVGHETLIKREIAEVQADTTLRKAERKAELNELNDTLASIVPVKYPDSIPIVAKYYDKLAKVIDTSE